MQSKDDVMPNGMRIPDMAKEPSAQARGEERRASARRAMRARKKRLDPQASWDMERAFFNHPDTKFRTNGTMARAMHYNTLADAQRAARRAARATRNSKRPPCGHVREKLALLELVR